MRKRRDANVRKWNDAGESAEAGCEGQRSCGADEFAQGRERGVFGERVFVVGRRSGEAQVCDAGYCGRRRHYYVRRVGGARAGKSAARGFAFDTEYSSCGGWLSRVGERRASVDSAGCFRVGESNFPWIPQRRWASGFA